jgi:IS5 family transposase
VEDRIMAFQETRKGQQWYFGAEAHICVDSKEVVMPSVIMTAASVADADMLPDLLHGEEKKVRGDAGYQGQTEAIHEAAPDAQDMTNRRTKFKDNVVRFKPNLAAAPSASPMRPPASWRASWKGYRSSH